MSQLRVALLAEDRNFVDFLVPAVELLALRMKRTIAWALREPLHGCRARRLKQDVERSKQDVDLVIVGADAAGRDHVVRGGGHRRKRAELNEWLGNDLQVCVVVADPCVEAWLYCSPRGLERGLSQALDTPFTMPSTWPVPRTEVEAKNQLGRLIRDGLDADLARNGFEFATEIVTSMLEGPVASASLQDCLRDLTQAMARGDRHRPGR